PPHRLQLCDGGGDLALYQGRQIRDRAAVRSAARQQWRRDAASSDRRDRAWHSARIHFARGTCRRPAREITAGLVSPTWRRLLGDAARGAATKTRRSPRRVSCREACPAYEARRESEIRENRLMRKSTANAPPGCAIWY